VTIKDGSVVEAGALVGDDVVVGPGARLKPFERLSVPWKAPESSDEEDEASDIEDVEECE